MYKLLPILLFSYSLAVTTNDDKILDSTIIKYIEYREKKYNLSLGIFDSRTGISVIGLSYDIYQQKDEFLNLKFCPKGNLLASLTTKNEICIFFLISL